MKNQKSPLSRTGIIVLAILSFGSFSARATKQVPELLIVGRDTLCLAQEPMEQLDSARQARFRQRVDRANRRPSDKPGEYVQVSTSRLWRGYAATWELDGDSLKFRYAVNIDDRTIDLRGLFAEGEFASWYTGELRTGCGAIIEYDGMGEDTYEYETVYTLVRGIVTETKTYRIGRGERGEIVRTPVSASEPGGERVSDR